MVAYTTNWTRPSGSTRARETSSPATATASTRSRMSRRRPARHPHRHQRCERARGGPGRGRRGRPRRRGPARRRTQRGVVVARDGRRPAGRVRPREGPGDRRQAGSRRAARRRPVRAGRRPNRNDPRPGWVYVHPHRCPRPRRASGWPARDAPARAAALFDPAAQRLPGATPAHPRHAAARPRDGDPRDGPRRLRRLVGRCGHDPPDPGAPQGDHHADGRAARLRRVRAERGRGGPRGTSSAPIIRQDPSPPRTLDGARRYSIGASFGTTWTTVEDCSRTTTIVRRGRVRVYDRVKRRSVTVSAGHRYVARRQR